MRGIVADMVGDDAVQRIAVDSTCFATGMMASTSVLM